MSLNNMEYYPLTHPQKRIWMVEKFYGGTSVSNIVQTIKFDLPINILILNKAINRVISENDGMRLRMAEHEGDIRQYVSGYHEVDLEVLDFRHENKNINEWIKCKTQEPFNLIDTDLFYMAVLLCPEGTNAALYIKVHHLITDAWGMGLIVNNIVGYYKAFIEAKNVELKQKHSYVDYILDEQDYLRSGRFEKSKEFWRSKFETAPQVTRLASEAKGVKNITADRKVYELSEETTKDIKEFCINNNVSVYVLFLTVLYIYFSKVTSKEDIVLGTVLHNRSGKSEKETAGMFVSTIPFRINIDGKESFCSALQVVAKELLSVMRHQRYPYDLLLQDLRQQHKIEETLFDVILSYQNVLFDAQQEWHFNGNETNSMAVHISDREDKSRLKLEIDYQLAVYNEENVNQFINHFMNLMSSGLKTPDCPVLHMEMLSGKEKQKLLFEFNTTTYKFPEEKTTHGIFEECADKTPDNTALVFKGEKLTYGELNRKANQLARRLRSKGVKPDDIVAIMADRSFEMLIGIYAVLKSGGAYLPIDPEYPRDRIEYILKDSGTSLLLTQNNYIGSWDKTGEVQVINLDDVSLYTGDYSNLEPANSSRNLAYVIYTSGSTGKPKGVMIEHMSVVNIILALQDDYPLGKNDAYLLKTTFTFDVSVAELFGWFFDGGRLVISEKGTEKDPEKILRDIGENNITHINFVPSMFNIFLNTLEERSISIVEKLRYIFVAGEAISCEAVRKFYSMVNTVRLENLYGPTESTIYATGYHLADLKDCVNVPIGKPLRNTRAYILGQNGSLLPAGASGELCLAGKGLARGYLNRPELTNDRFLPDPFVPGERVYRTGDLVRWLQDGNIEYLGRIDFQVKIRGYRVELGEIESELLKHELVREAIVIAREDANKNKYLCAYLISEDKLITEELRSFLLESLPEYMVPAFFVQLDKIPLSWNGKADRKALPEPDMSLNKSVEYAAAANRVEELLVEAWEEILGFERIGINDNFFSLGGDSIKAIQIMAYLNKYRIKLETKDIFLHPTISEVSRYVKITEKEACQGIVTGEVRLTPIQSWFFEQDFTDRNYWNQAFMLFKEDGFDEAVLRKVFSKITQHHDALRMIYSFHGGNVTQHNRDIDGESFSLDIWDLVGEEDPQAKIIRLSEELQSTMDLSNGPLIRLGLFRTGYGDHLLIAVHHLVIDGVSWRILFEDFEKGYLQALQGKEIKFDQKTDSFKDWAKSLEVYAATEKLSSEIEYWKKQEMNEVPLLPKEYDVETNRYVDGEVITVSISKEETDNLLKKVNKAFNTEINDILLTALGLTIREWTHSNKVLVNLEGHGREEVIHGVDISRTIGWFTSIYPVMLDISYPQDLSYQIKVVKEYLKKLPDKGIGYGILKYLVSSENKNRLDFKLKPEICFNYLGQFDKDINTSLFELSNIPAGSMISMNSQRKYVFDINAMVVNSKLNIMINYNKYQYEKDTVAQIAEGFKKNLLKIIDHCIGRETSEITPSDLSSKGLELEDLDDIFEVLGGN